MALVVPAGYLAVYLVAVNGSMADPMAFISGGASAENILATCNK